MYGCREQGPPISNGNLKMKKKKECYFWLCSRLLNYPYRVVTDKSVITDNGDPNTGVMTAIEKETEPIEPIKHCSDEGQCETADELTSQYNYNDITPVLRGLLHNADKM